MKRDAGLFWSGQVVALSGLVLAATGDPGKGALLTLCGAALVYISGLYGAPGRG